MQMVTEVGDGGGVGGQRFVVLAWIIVKVEAALVRCDLMELHRLRSIGH